MDKLSLKNTLIIGITLFSMFFGAGNLIFPPLIGAKSGEQFVLAILGFILTAVVIPTVAVIVVSKHRGLKNNRSFSSKVYTNFYHISLFTNWTMCCYS